MAPPDTFKVCHLITRMIIGGAQENTLLSVKGLRDLGHEVILAGGPTRGPEGNLLRVQGAAPAARASAQVGMNMPAFKGASSCYGESVLAAPRMGEGQ